MYVDNRSSFLATVFTLLKLGIAVAVIVFLGSQFLDMWQANSGHDKIQNAVQEMQSQ